jgi:hypothetical protein
VAEDRTDPSEQIPEADLLGQRAPLDSALIDDEHGSVDRATPVEPADEADRWEQQLPVAAAEDDYPHDDPHDRFEAG